MEVFHKAMITFSIVQSVKSLIKVIADLIFSILLPSFEPIPMKTIFNLSFFNLKYLFFLLSLQPQHNQQHRLKVDYFF